MKSTDILTNLSNEDIKLARELTASILNNLSDKIEIASLSLNSKLPFKALTIREVLIYRMAELASASLQLYEDGKLLPAFILTRSMIETVSLLYCLHRGVKAFNSDHDTGKLDLFLMKAIIGSKDKEVKYEPHQILSAIDKLDKKLEGIRHSYDSLSEFTHPNWSGTMGAFGKINKEDFVLELGRKPGSLKIAIGFAPFIVSLQVFAEFYNDLAELIRELNDYFESMG